MELWPDILMGVIGASSVALGARWAARRAAGEDGTDVMVAVLGVILFAAHIAYTVTVEDKPWWVTATVLVLFVGGVLLGAWCARVRPTDYGRESKA